MIESIENNFLTVKIDTLGAELISVKNKETGREYMWDKHSDAWNKSSPILFPNIGALKNGKFSYNGKEYTGEKHGFAKNKEFKVIKKTESEISFNLTWNNDTYVNYPFKFNLTLTYILNENELTMNYVIKNEDNKTIYFALGAHPAFMGKKESLTGEKMGFNAGSNLVLSDVNLETGCFKDSKTPIKCDKDGSVKITYHTFDNDAYVFENNQVKSVTLFEEDKPFVNVSFDAPIVGIWSPIGRDNPFVCIEPWYGIADKDSFNGEISERNEEQHLDIGEVFDESIKISFYML